MNILQTWILNLNFVCQLTIGIPLLHFLLSMAKAVSSTIELFNSVTSDSVYSFNFAMCTFGTMCLPIELVPYSDGWRRTWWQTIYMMPRMPVSSIPQCQWTPHEGSCLELFQVIGRLEPIFIEAHQASKMICKVRSSKSRIQAHSFLEDIMTSR
jgi:hypothetical protein